MRTRIASLVLLMSVVSTLWGVPRTGNKEQLQRLVRLPRVEFAPAIDFDRTVGFLVYPEASAIAAKAPELSREAKTPEDAEKSLEAGRLYEVARNHPQALREYSRALNLLRRKVELYPENAEALLQLADALICLGHFPEAEAQLERGLAEGGKGWKYWLVKARFHRERAWRLAMDSQHNFGDGSVIDSLVHVSYGSTSAQDTEEARRHLADGESAFREVVELKVDDPQLWRELGAFLSFREGLSAAFSLIGSVELDRRRRLRESIFSERAIANLRKAASFESADAEMIGSVAMALFYHSKSASLPGRRQWTAMNEQEQREIRNYFDRLQSLSASENSKVGAEAAETLGCLQLHMLGDLTGAERSFRQSLTLDPRRGRSWDLLILCVGLEENESALVEVCEERAKAEVNVRNKVMLAKAYDRSGDSLRAQMSALEALGLNSNDFLANLTLACLLMKREDFAGFSGRVQDCLTKAQRQLGVGRSSRSLADLALTKSIYYALIEDMDKARAAFNELPRNERQSSEAQELARILGY